VSKGPTRGRGAPDLELDFFVVRTPLLPLERFLEWSADLESTADAGDLSGALGRDRERLRARLRALLTDPVITEALYLASPSLEETLPHWCAAPDSARGQKVERALVRYFGRMTSRPTPFGVFAGLSLGHPGRATRLQLGPRAAYRKHSRLDCGALLATLEGVRRDPAVTESLRYWSNPSRYDVAGQLRYAQPLLRGRDRDYVLSVVERTPYLDAVLSRATTGATVAELVAELCAADEAVTADEARAFVGELIECELLCPGLDLPITGVEPDQALTEQLEALPAARPVAAQLTAARATLGRWDTAALGIAPAEYRQLAASLPQLPDAGGGGGWFQVDLHKPAELELGPEVRRELGHAVQLLHRLGARVPYGAELARFATAFTSRFEGREVPLLVALDADVGVGLGPTTDDAPLTRDLRFPAPPPQETFGPRERRLQAYVADARAHRRHAVELTDADLEALAVDPPPPLPESLVVTARIAAASAAHLARGEFQVWANLASGPTALFLLGRFLHGDARLAAAAQRFAAAEQALWPGRALADIVHLPVGRVGNVTARPVLRDYEIPYLGASGAPRDHQLSLQDLRVSVRGGQVVLRSQSLGCEVLPRLTAAHAWMHPHQLKLYRFLAALQGHVVCSLEWGTALESAVHRPRLTHGRVVLSLESWHLDSTLLAPLDTADVAVRWRRLRELRSELGIPRLAVLLDEDRGFIVDFDNPLSVEAFAQAALTAGGGDLREVFPPPGESVVTGPEGTFAHELMGLMIGRTPRPPGAVTTPAPACAAAPRTFVPGSEWLYVRLFAGSGVGDRVLREVVQPAVAGGRSSGAVDRWFFLRYSDPEWHLRVRLHGEPRRLMGEVLPALNALAQPLLDAGVVSRVELATYEREVERYGGPNGVELAEQLFAADSHAVLALVELLEGEGAAEARWRLALAGAHMLLDDLGLDTSTCLSTMRRVRDALRAEFGADAGVEATVGARFRAARHELAELLDRSRALGGDVGPGIEVLAQRSHALRPIVEQLRACAAAGRLGVPIEELAVSYVHMFVNRLLMSQHRLQELVLYDLLTRLYEGQLARARRPSGSTPREQE
jgi:thiopeptide-type bacteriocin biosynthesis protein